MRGTSRTPSPTNVIAAPCRARCPHRAAQDDLNAMPYIGELAEIQLHTGGRHAGRPYSKRGALRMRRISEHPFYPTPRGRMISAPTWVRRPLRCGIPVGRDAHIAPRRIGLDDDRISANPSLPKWNAGALHEAPAGDRRSPLQQTKNAAISPKTGINFSRPARLVLPLSQKVHQIYHFLVADVDFLWAAYYIM